MLPNGKFILVAALFAVMACRHDPTDVDEDSNRAFIDGLVPHHEMALMMADDAIMKASRESLKQMARKMKEDQAKEITELKSIRKSMFGSDSTPAGMEMKDMPAGDMYDMMWMHMMIDHHQGAIDLSTLALDAGVAKPLKTIAQNALEAQKMEQAMMQDSLMAWFGEKHRFGDGPH